MDRDGGILVSLLQVVVRGRGRELPIFPVQNRVQESEGGVRDERRPIPVGEGDGALVRWLVSERIPLGRGKDFVEVPPPLHFPREEIINNRIGLDF